MNILRTLVLAILVGLTPASALAKDPVDYIDPFVGTGNQELYILDAGSRDLVAKKDTGLLGFSDISSDSRRRIRSRRTLPLRLTRRKCADGGCRPVNEIDCTRAGLTHILPPAAEWGPDLAGNKAFPWSESAPRRAEW